MDESPASPAFAPVVSLTPAGTIALVAAVVTTAVGALMLSGPIFASGLLALVLLGVARIAARRHLGGMRVKRELPARGRTGESFTVETRLVTGSAFPAGTTVRFRDPLASTTGGKRLIPGDAMPALRYTGKSSRRGIHRPRPWTITSTWPLGLFTTERSGAFHDNDTLLLQPKPFLPQRLRSHLERLALESVENSPEPPDPVSDFRLLREFRPGDSVKRIHWPASLRTGHLQVSELEPPRPKPRRYGILIHSYEPAGQVLTPETFEMILRIAAGLLQRFQHEEIPVVFRQYPDIPASLAHRSEVSQALDRLALCRRHPLVSLDPLTTAARDFRHCDEVFLLSDCPRREWEAVLREHFPANTCIDATSLSSHSRPGLKTRLRLTA
jgi:uncharacterized protein (DUF58 family)